mmetsp:Transcript_15348/g.50407  ORF Transcript_15348/g.50407 Transcript_15348/m.50407 type:complete len:232 (+) Transcript_15348:38-733(+)
MSAVQVSREEDAILRARLVALATARPNADSPLKKLSRRFFALCEAHLADSGSTEEVEKAYEALAREIELYEFQVSRTVMQAGANEREQESCKSLRVSLDTEIESAKAEIELLKDELVKARKERAQKEEYEELRAQILQNPSRADTEAAIKRAENDILMLEAESDAADAAVEVRRKQFRAMMVAVDELQREFEEEATEEEEPGEALPTAPEPEPARGEEGEAEAMEIEEGET